MRTRVVLARTLLWLMLFVSPELADPGAAAFAQSYTSGSTGALGALQPTANITIPLPPDGVLHYSSVTIPAGVTVKFARNAANTPVVLLASGDVTISGTLDVSGGGGGTNAAGPGGPGGFAGGIPGTPASSGQGPGGGAPGSDATYGASVGFISLVPLFGGSGGGGGQQGPLDNAGGGGGGGAIAIASSTQIVVTGTITAEGGFSFGGAGGCSFASGNGSGGAIRLVAPQVTGTGFLNARGGRQPFSTCKPGGGNGLIRIESFTPGFTGTTVPAPFLSAAPGPVVAVGNPALVSLPTLRLSSIGGQPTPGSPGGGFASADVALPPGTVNPVPVVLIATNTPPGTSFIVKVIGPSGPATTVTATADLGGSFASATYTAQVTLPAGQVSVLNAFGTFSLPPQVSSRWPSLDGEPAEALILAAVAEGSELWLQGRSGRLRAVAALPYEEQLRLALAWAGMLGAP